MRALLLALLMLTSPALAGCIGDTAEDAQTTATDTLGASLVPTEDQLWPDPQTAPHPAFDYPTFTTVPENAPTFWQPIEAKELSTDDLIVEHVAEDPEGIPYGSGIALFGELVIVPGRATGTTWLFDISDPEDPQLVSEFDAPGRDVDTIAFPDGRLFAVFATDQGTVPVWNLTDPSDPTHVTDLQPTAGSHNVAVVPGTPILYNANSAGGGVEGKVPGQGTGITEIYDLSDPHEPEHVQDWANGYGCHDITFHIGQDEDKLRAYCAGKAMTQIWDITDPAEPEVVINVPYPHGVPGVPTPAHSPATFSHLAMVNQDATVLIVGDENGGGAAPACDTWNAGGVQTVSGPLGNLYFYDITDEQDPQLLSFISPSNHLLDVEQVAEDPEGEAQAACTAHFGRLVPHEDRELLAMAFYGMGVNLIDFSDPSNPFIISDWKPGTNTWDVWYYNGYLVTGDTRRGMDVLTLGPI